MKHSGIALLLFVILSCTQQEKSTAPSSTTPEPAAQATVRNDLPSLLFVTTAGKEINAKKLTGKNIIILFLPDCDHCQREAVHIQENLAAFRLYSVYFIAADTPESIRNFATEHKLEGTENITFGRAEGEQILKSFGAVAAPSIYIYNEDGSLKKDFHGETDINLILNSL